MVESRMKALQIENGSVGNCAAVCIPIRLTPHHNVIFTILNQKSSRLFKRFLIAAAFKPTRCDQPVGTVFNGLPHAHLRVSITESERVMPSVLKRIEVLLDKVGLEQEHFVVRMTGCPNGCARPYMAELGFVGSAPPTKFARGTPAQTRLAAPYMERLHP